MPQTPRIEPQDAHDHAQDGALIVCAYDDAEKCRGLHVPGSIPLQDLHQREDDLATDTELIFYCN